MNTDRLLTAEEVANVLGVSRSKAYTMMRLKEIPTVTIGKNVRVCKRDLEMFIEDNRTYKGCKNGY
jgi:excisionase family DNA binding protein